MCHPSYEHYTEKSIIDRRCAGHFLCDNNQVKINHKMDITWIRDPLIKIGAIHVADSRYVVSNRITDVLHEIDMEYMIGLHCSVSHTPSESTQRRDGAWTYFLHYGFCEPIDETVHLLCHTTLESRVKALIMHNLEEKLIIKRLKG